MQNVCQKAVTVKRIVFPREGKKKEKKKHYLILKTE